MLRLNDIEHIKLIRSIEQPLLASRLAFIICMYLHYGSRNAELFSSQHAPSFAPTAIARRLSTIANADKVVVMDQGRIVKQGTYQQLLALRGKLWNYHQIQNEVSQSRS